MDAQPMKALSNALALPLALYPWYLLSPPSPEPRFVPLPNRFLRDVETGLVQPICGGEAAEYVGRQPADPALDLDSMDPIAAASGGSGGSGGSGAVDLTGGNSGASRFGSFTGGSHSGGRGEGRNSGWF